MTMKTIKYTAYAIAGIAFGALYYIAGLSDHDAITIGSQLRWTIPLVIIMGGCVLIGSYIDQDKESDKK